MKVSVLYLISSLLLITLISCMEVKGSMVRPAGMEEETFLQLINEKLLYTNAGVCGVYPPLSPVDTYGELQVKGAQLCDERGNPIQLRGLFLRGLLNESKFINHGAFTWISQKWKIDVIRIPVFTDGWYAEPPHFNSPGFLNYIHEAIHLSEKFGIYCIIDWHILKDGNPFIHAKEAREFFKKLAFLYGAKKHVIYELCNEPNGANVKWDNVIKRYAEYIIPVIRAGNSNAIIIVGTGTWSQDVEDAAANPLEYKNIMYAFHFYSGTHKQEFRERIKTTSEKIALFSTEWGNSDCYAQGGPFTNEALKWLELMENRKISWCHYALTDFPEGAALLRPHVRTDGKWENESLTPSGKFIVNILTNNK